MFVSDNPSLEMLIISFQRYFVLFSIYRKTNSEKVGVYKEKVGVYSIILLAFIGAVF